MGDANYVVMFYIADNHWNGQKPSMEKSTVGNEPYTKRVAVLGGSFVLYGKASSHVFGIRASIMDALIYVKIYDGLHCSFS